MRSKSGIPDAYDTVRIKHLYGTSTIQFNSFDQGREAFQATERDIVWFDEEVPLDVYTEGLTRTMTTGGIVMLTFTPLKGLSQTVMFLEQQAKAGNCQIITADWSNAPHLSEEDCAEMLKAYPPHQRDARSKGIPSMGSGAIYPVAEEDIVVKPFVIPKHFRHVYGLDVGWNNTAAVFGAYDPDNEILYITSDYKRGNAEPTIHAGAIKARAKGDGKPGVIDPASKGRSQTDGTQLLKLYRGLGLNVMEANNAVESGLYKCWEGLSLGKIKIFNTCNGFLDEFRVYRRDDKGKIVKQDDHIMDAFRYLVISGIQLAKPENPVKKKIIQTSLGSWMGR
jgi:phage terminase large subunit-like protein